MISDTPEYMTAELDRNAKKHPELTTTIFSILAKSDEFGFVFIHDYAAQSGSEVRRKVLEVAIRQGYNGTVAMRLKELGWKVVELEARTLQDI